MTLTSTQLRELAEAATPGTWRVAHHGTVEIEAPPNQLVADLGVIGRAETDARLLVALRNELPRIIADRELAEACERLDLSGLRDRTSPFSNGLSTHELAVLAIKMSIGDACGYCGNPSPKCYCWNDE